MARRFHSAVAILIFSALYFGAGKFGLSLAFVNASASPVWPPTGLALAALLLWGNWLWPGIFIGAFLVNSMTQGSLATTIGVATGNTLEALIAAALVRKFANGGKVFERAQDIFKYVFLAAILSTMVSATLGVTSLALGGFVSWSQYRPIWLTWWLGNLASNLTVTPLLLLWGRSQLPKLNPRKILEGVAMLAIVILVCQLVFSDALPFAYLMLPPLVWAAFRFGARSALALMLLMSGLALHSTLHGEGPFASPDHNQAVLYLQVFMGISTIMVLLLAAGISERTKAEHRLEVQYAVSRVLAEAEALAEGTPKILKTLCEAGGWDAGLIWNVDRGTNELFCAEVWHAAAIKIPAFEADARQRRFAPGTCLPGQVWISGEPRWISDIAQDGNFPRAPVMLREGLQAVVCFPIELDRKILGVIECFSRRVRAQDNDFLHVLEALGSQTGQFIERQRALEAVRESEARFRQVTETINEVFWMSDISKERILYVSPGYEAIWGQSCASLYAAPQRWMEAIHPEDRTRVMTAAQTRQISGEYDEVYRIRRPGGSIRWIHDRAFPVRDKAGNVHRIVGIAADITVRKQAEAQLAMLGHAVESTSELICITDLQDRFVFVNRAFQQAYGYPEAEVLGKPPALLFSPNNPAALITEIIAQTRRGGWRGEVNDLRKDGTEFPISLSTSLVKNAQGRVIGLMGVARDITDRKHAEAVLRESEEKFRTLFESAPIAIALHAADGSILHTNTAYQKMLGYTDDELRQLGVKRFTHPDDVAEGQRLFSELVAGRRDNYQREKRYRHKDGRLVWGRSLASTLHSGNGALQFIISMVEDITQRRAVVEALRESEQNLRLIAENTTDVIFAFNMNRQPLFINSAVAQLTGYSFTEIQEQKFVNWIHPDDQERMLRHWEELYQGKAYADVEFRLITKAGQVKWCSSTWGPILDEKGVQVGVQGRERDLTQRKELENQLLEIGMNERRHIGHELHDGLGQWLTGIALKTKALEENLAEEKSDQVGMAKEVVALLNQTIGQTRSLAFSLDPVHVEADGLVVALEKLVEKSGNLFGRICVFKCKEQSLHASAQTGLALYRITQEAIRNAVEHGKASRIEVELEAIATQLQLRIRDDGSGFASQARSEAGMGLRIMQYRASSLGGTFKIQSQPGAGAEITCTVPQNCN